MTGRVAGKIAIVFGGGQTPGQTVGNGRATAMTLAREGAHVTVVDRHLGLAEETVRLINQAKNGSGSGSSYGSSSTSSSTVAADAAWKTCTGSATAMQADATREDEVSAIIAAVVKQHGRLDLLHNNIGASIELGDAPADTLTEAAFDRSFAVNVKSAWFATKHALPVMRAQQHGSIVNISSLAAAQAYPLLGYKTMKAAMIAMTENVAAANAEYGIRVNAILPGLMNTPMAIEHRVKQGRAREEVIGARDSRIPLGRKMGTGWDTANAALFLHSDDASFITGTVLIVDGGELVSHGL